MSLYPGFRSFLLPSEGPGGRIQYHETQRARVAAAEPLAPEPLRAEAFETFARECRDLDLRALMLPVSEALSGELVRRGNHRLQIGAEPIFDLAEYFGWDLDPIETFPRARSLKRRGARVVEIPAADFASDPRFRKLMDDWLASRKTAPLSFLSQPDPWFALEERKFFAVEVEGRFCGFVSAVPVYPRKACYLSEIVCARPSKSGTTELLLIETMRKLLEQGWREVRLGMAPLALRDRGTGLLDRALDWAFRHSSRFYNFRSLYEFKCKFNPTRWDPLFLVSDQPIGLRALAEVVGAHLPDPAGRDWSRWLRPGLRPRGNLRLPVTLGLSAIILALHAARAAHPEIAPLFERVQFRPTQWELLPLALGPLFHNTVYHLLGDTSTLIAFSGAVEWIAGSRLAFLAVGAGLWLSNPLTVLLLDPTLRLLGDQVAYAKFLSIPDMGASNGVYAAAGALAALVARPRAILLPLALNALFYTWVSGKILALHHLVALALGFFLGIVI